MYEDEQMDDLSIFLAQEPDTALLLSPEQEEEVSAKYKSITYAYEANYGPKSLLILGVPHSYGDSALGLGFERYFMQFKPDFVFVEGGETLHKGIDSKEEAARVGETQLALFLATQLGVECLSWDINLGNETMSLREKFGDEAILGWIIGLGYKHYLNMNSNMPYAVDKLVSMLNERMIGLIFNEDISEAKLDEICIKYTGSGLSELTLEMAERISSPRYEGETNAVIRYLNDLRDPNAVNKIFNTFKERNRVMVVAGKGHAVTWEPVFEELFGKVEMLS